jgi:hypothetical protein
MDAAKERPTQRKFCEKVLETTQVIILFDPWGFLEWNFHDFQGVT